VVVRIWLAAFVVTALAIPCFAEGVVPIVAGKVYTWDAAKNGNLTVYQAGALTLQFRATGESSNAVVTIAQKNGPKTTYAFIGGFETPATQFFVGHLDPANPTMEVVLGPYSGGAHCCMPKDVFVIWGGKWRHHQINAGVDSDELEYPKDIDGDGTPDFALYDDWFAYQFGCFACSWLPPQVFYLKGDKIIDATASGKYDRLLEADLKKAKDACTGNNPMNGLCAGVAADGARLRKFKTNWRWLLQHYSRTDNWEYPDGCTIDVPDGKDCPADKVVEFKSFPDSLAWFLRRHGYITGAQKTWATDERRKPEYRKS
jgi:hypothetical protein